MLDLPEDFIRNIRHAFGIKGDQFLLDLPALLAEAARRWDLVLGRPFLLSYNYVTAARRADNTDVVLKIGVPAPELTSEMDALRLYNGRGMVRLIDADTEKGMLLEHRLRPGTMLAELQDDQRATEVAAGLMRSLWQPVPEHHRFIRLTDWFTALMELRNKYDGGTGPFPPGVVDAADRLVKDFFAEDEAPVVLHGDFHHYNVLMHGDGWLAIDPKGVIGPRGYEVGPFLLNPLSRFLDDADLKQKTERRFAILAEQLGLERERIRGWAIAYAVLSAWWDHDDQGRGGEYAIRCAELFMSMH
jgi:streptomycin 6-kinase